MTFDGAKRKWLFLTGGIICLLVAFTLTAVFRGKFADPSVPSHTTLSEFTPDVPANITTETSEAHWVVYVTGAVAHPGVYKVSSDSRINDALIKAGGFSDLADPERINLASKIEDGMHIKIPSREELDIRVFYEEETPPKAYTQTTTRKVCLNTASTLELQRLPGVGPQLAQTIVDYRNANGPFRNIRELTKVRGVGPKRFETLKNLVSISP